jgi:hypothetical protein
MTKERENEVMRAILKDVAREKGFKIVPATELKRDMGNVSKRTGIPVPELLEVIKPIAEELFTEMFSAEPGKTLVEKFFSGNQGEAKAS